MNGFVNQIKNKSSWKIVFFGLGSIGKRHLKILKEKFPSSLFYSYSQREKNLSEKEGVNSIHSLSELKKIKPDVAFITNPTYIHIKTAIMCAKLNCHLFIEKPLSNKLTGINELERLVKRKKLTTFVAYNLRFHPVIAKLKEYCQNNCFLHLNAVCSSYLPNWRPNTDWKKSYSAISKLGGGVILDLSHEIDFTEHLLGEIKTISGSYSKRSSLTYDAEDFADILINTKSGPANIHINFFSHFKQRLIQIDFKELTVIGDLINFTIEEYKKEKIVKKIELKSDYNFSYEQEINYFFANIGKKYAINNLAKAKKIFYKIIKFKKENIVNP